MSIRSDHEHDRDRHRGPGGAWRRRAGRDRSRDDRRHPQVRAVPGGLPLGGDRRGRLQGVPPGQRGVRPTSGRPQPDDPHQSALRGDHPHAAGLAGRHLPDLQPGLGSPDHPPERAVPLRGPGARSRPAVGSGPGRPDDPRSLLGHRAQRDGLPPGGSVPARGARHPALGRCGVLALPPQPDLATAAPEVQDQLLGLLDRLRSGHVQRRRGHRGQPHGAGRHRRGRLPRLRRRRARSEPPPCSGPRGVHHPRGAAADDRGMRPRVRTDRQPRQQAARPHEVGRRRARLRRAPAADPGVTEVPDGQLVLAGRRARPGRRARRRARGHRRWTRSPRWARANRCSCRAPLPSSVGRSPTSCGAWRTPRCPRWPGVASATSPRRSSGASLRSAGTSASRCASRTARTSCSGA